MKHRLYVCDISVGGQTFRFSSGGYVEINGHSYADGLSVQSIASTEANLVIANAGNSASSLFLNHPIRGAKVTVTQVMSDGVADALDVVFDGVGDSLTLLDASRAEFRAVNASGLGRWPSAEVAPPVFNHLPTDGTVISFAGKKLKIGAN